VKHRTRLIARSLILALVPAASWAGPVNVNTADAATLAKELDGIGPAHQLHHEGHGEARECLERRRFPTARVHAELIAAHRNGGGSHWRSRRILRGGRRDERDDGQGQGENEGRFGHELECAPYRCGASSTVSGTGRSASSGPSPSGAVSGSPRYVPSSTPPSDGSSLGDASPP